MEPFSVIRDVYETMNIYKSVVLYGDESEFAGLRNVLVENDYPLVQHMKDRSSGRMFCVHINDDTSIVEWDTVSVVFAMGDTVFDHAKRIILEKQLEEYILLVKV